MNKLALRHLIPDLEDDLYDALLIAGTVKEIKAGEILLRAGQIIRSSFLILEGTVKVYRSDDEGKEFFIYLLKPGQACALTLLCAIAHEKSKVLARTLTNTLALSVPLQYANEWMRRYKSWYEFVIRSYRHRFEEMLQTIDAMAFSNMDARLLFYLRKQMNEFGPQLKLKHYEIASDLNSSREVISRLLKKLENQNLLVLHRNFIEMSEV